ncbi:MAG: sel1 repeat family protein [Zoogloeaceae bacterium]|jgi:TPR repeat protein|nr:sel1 repeat family protein [Zoogloeaceae bacterium]
MTKAIPLLQASSCDAKVSPACDQLALIYEYSEHMEKDKEKAAQYKGKSCDSGNSYGCFVLGRDYLHGDDGVTKNGVKAASLFQKGCDLDNVASCERLGDLYMEGEEGIEQDTARAIELYEKIFSLQKNGCENDKEPFACESLGNTYKKGKIVPVDLAKSAAAYAMALAQWQHGCDSEDYISCFGLARMYEEGEGVEKDDRQALQYYDKACQQYYPGCLKKSLLGTSE